MENQLEMPKERRKLNLKPGRKQLIVGCAVLMVAVALALNFMLFGKPEEPVPPADDTGGEVTETVETDGYFSATQVSRQRARDEALEVLQSVVDNENADEATKTSALLEISQLAKEIECEANIESLVLSRGFAQCVAVVNGDKCTVVVSAENLTPGQLSQINEIVYEQTGILPVDINIIAKP